jgi:hypothetical protein
MKTKIELTIETPDDIKLVDYEGIVPEEECKEFAKNWHEDLVNFMVEIGKGRLYDILAEALEEYCNEDGELPSFDITVKKEETER